VAVAGPAADPHGRKLMEALGVVGMPAVRITAASELTASRDCVSPLCTEEALPGADRCRRHASIGEVRAANGKPGDPVGLAALERMDAGKPQTPEPKEPVSSESPDGRRTKYLDAFRRYQRENGRWPLPVDAKTTGYLPSGDVVAKHAGGWASLWAELGAGPVPTGQAAAKYRRTPSSGRAAGGSAKTQAVSPAAAVLLATPQPSSPAPLDDAALSALVEARPDDTTVGPGAGGAEGSVGQSADGASLAAIGEPGQEVGLTAPVPATMLGFSLALTGDFARDADRVRAEAELLRRQADALEVIATGIDQLADTLGTGSP
jgi:hypothetical protein